MYAFVKTVSDAMAISNIHKGLTYGYSAFYCGAWKNIAFISAVTMTVMQLSSIPVYADNASSIADIRYDNEALSANNMNDIVEKIEINSKEDFYSFVDTNPTIVTGILNSSCTPTSQLHSKCILITSPILYFSFASSLRITVLVSKDSTSLPSVRRRG